LLRLQAPQHLSDLSGEVVDDFSFGQLNRLLVKSKEPFAIPYLPSYQIMTQITIRQKDGYFSELNPIVSINKTMYSYDRA
jgi:hypothetical protein